MEKKCSKCIVVMKKGNKIDSGNSTFQEYYCPECGSKIIKAIGVN